MNGIHERLAFGHMGANGMRGQKEQGSTLRIVLFGCGSFQDCTVGLATRPGPHIVVPHDLLEGQHEIEIRDVGRQRRVGEDLIEKVLPVFTETAGHLDLKHLGVRAQIRMASNKTRTRANFLFDPEGADGDGPHLLDRFTDMVQIRLGRYGFEEFGD